MHIGRQPVRGCGADCQQIHATGRRRSQLLFSGLRGATAGLCTVAAEPGHELGGVPEQWRGVGR